QQEASGTMSVSRLLIRVGPITGADMQQHQHARDEWEAGGASKRLFRHLVQYPINNLESGRGKNRQDWDVGLQPPGAMVDAPAPMGTKRRV
ncbi:MAG TPA: hypothetical protein VF510_15765, partial [Ktedonobacterales bacterium]